MLFTLQFPKRAAPVVALHTPTARWFARSAWSLPQLAVVVAVWLATVGNLALWRQLMALPEISGGRGLLFGLGFGVWVAALLTALMSLLAWPRVFKVVATVLLLMTASASHYMLAYSVVIDPSMVVNVLHTDARETSDLLSPGLFITLAGVGVLPAWWLWRQPVGTVNWRRMLASNTLLLVASLVVAAAVLVAMFQDFASLMRNHKEVRYLINLFPAVGPHTTAAKLDWEPVSANLECSSNG